MSSAFHRRMVSPGPAGVKGIPIKLNLHNFRPRQCVKHRMVSRASCSGNRGNLIQAETQHALKLGVELRCGALIGYFGVEAYCEARRRELEAKCVLGRDSCGPAAPFLDVSCQTCVKLRASNCLSWGIASGVSRSRCCARPTRRRQVIALGL
jgi:hypothetical protein